MERECNIDAKGKLFRFTIGIFSVFSGIVIISLFNLNIFISEEILMMGLFFNYRRIICYLGGQRGLVHSQSDWYQNAILIYTFILTHYQIEF